MRLSKTFEPSWEGDLVSRFLLVPSFAGYKTDSDISEAVKNGQWGGAYVGGLTAVHRFLLSFR